MAEPPAKRARRMDSSTMWDVNDKRPRLPHSPDPESDRDGRSRQGSSKPDGPRKNGRDDRRYRSRSRDRNERRRDKSRSRDRYDRDRDRDGGRRDRDRDRDRDPRGGRDRDRSTSRDRRQSRREYPSKSDRYDLSRSPVRNGTRAPSRTPPRGSKGDRRDDRGDTRSRGDDRQVNGTSKYKRERVKDTDDEKNIDMMDEDEDPDDIDTLMRKAVGFSRFKSTKNTKVPGNNVYGVRKEKKTEYRQYMNRTGGFNRPLSPSR